MAEDFVVYDPSIPEGAEWPSGQEEYRPMAEMATGVYEDGKLAESWQEVNVLDVLARAGELPEDRFTPEMP